MSSPFVKGRSAFHSSPLTWRFCESLVGGESTRKAVLHPQAQGSAVVAFASCPTHFTASMETIARNLETFFLPSIEGQSIMRPVGGPQLRIIPVDDKTGLKGVYEIRVNIRRTQLPAAGGAGGRNSGGLGSRMEYDPPLPKAFEEQLGLVLTRGKVPVEYIVVEHIELPSEN